MGKMVKATAENRNKISDGAKVRLNPAYGHGTKYFVCNLSNTNCMLADCKRDWRDGCGYIYSIYDIQAFEIFE